MSNNKYEKAKVYKIWSTVGDKIYVGSTCNEYLSQRMVKHRSTYKRWKDDKTKMITSFKLFDEYGVNNCFIELLEAKECNSKDELKQVEGKHIRELVCVNKRIEGSTRKEYYENHSEQLIEYQSQYRKNNKVKVAERQNEIFNCECGKSYTYGHKTRHLKTIRHCKFIESQITKPEDGAK
jgi:hypothetical protein